MHALPHTHNLDVKLSHLCCHMANIDSCCPRHRMPWKQKMDLFSETTLERH